MKKLVWVLLACVPLFSQAAEPLPVVKKRVAAEMRHCLLNPAPDSGNGYVSGCVYEAAEKLAAAAMEYARQGMDEVRGPTAELTEEERDYIKDIAWFKSSIGACDTFEAAAMSPAAKVEYANSCRLYFARMAAEYFYNGSDGQEDKRTWPQVVDDLVKKSVY